VGKVLNAVREELALDSDFEMLQPMLCPMHAIAFFNFEPVSGIRIRRLRGNSGNGV